MLDLLDLLSTLPDFKKYVAWNTRPCYSPTQCLTKLQTEFPAAEAYVLIYPFELEDASFDRLPRLNLAATVSLGYIKAPYEKVGAKHATTQLFSAAAPRDFVQLDSMSVLLGQGQGTKIFAPRFDEAPTAAAFNDVWVAIYIREDIAATQPDKWIWKYTMGLSPGIEGDMGSCGRMACIMALRAIAPQIRKAAGRAPPSNTKELNAEVIATWDRLEAYYDEYPDTLASHDFY